MSKISQELQVLFYLNEKVNRTQWTSIKEIADYIEVSERQARRYLEELNLINDITIITKRGREGGYRLSKKLDKGLAIPENILLALSIAMKRNERIEEVLASLPNYVITESVIGDNSISNDVLDNLELLIKAIKNQKEVIFFYKDISTKPYYCKPYKIYFTNKTYYLLCVDNKDQYRKLDISLMRDIKILSSFKVDNKVIDLINKETKNFGIKSEKETTLRVKCKEKNTLNIFDKYFEGKGIIDEEHMIYTVTGNSENELFYPLFRISTKSYEFLDNDFKAKYLTYLKNQIKSIKNEDFSSTERLAKFRNKVLESIKFKRQVLIISPDTYYYDNEYANPVIEEFKRDGIVSRELEDKNGNGHYPFCSLSSSARLCYLYCKNEKKIKNIVKFEQNYSFYKENGKFHATAHPDAVAGDTYYECKCQEIVNSEGEQFTSSYLEAKHFNKFFDDINRVKVVDGHLRFNLNNLGLNIDKDYSEAQFNIKQLMHHLLALAEHKEKTGRQQTLQYIIFVPDNYMELDIIYSNLINEINEIFGKENNITTFAKKHGINLPKPDFVYISKVKDFLL